MKTTKIFEKIELFHIAIALIILIFVIFGFYQYNSSIPKKAKLEISQTKQLPQQYFNIEDIDNKNKKVTCKIDKTYINEKEYNNYVIGKGTAREVDCSIVVKEGNDYYKIKTLHEGTSTEGRVNLVGCIRTNHLKENCEILLYDNENKTLYQYVGGQSEENI